jgi:hypothetical protein
MLRPYNSLDIFRDGALVREKELLEVVVLA